MDLDGEVRTAQFTLSAPDAQIRARGINLAVPEREDLLGAKGDTNIAALAPALPDNVFEESLLFAHSPTLSVLSATSCSSPVPDQYHSGQMLRPALKITDLEAQHTL